VPDYKNPETDLCHDHDRSTEGSSRMANMTKESSAAIPEGDRPTKFRCEASDRCRVFSNRGTGRTRRSYNRELNGVSGFREDENDAWSVSDRRAEFDSVVHYFAGLEVQYPPRRK